MNQIRSICTSAHETENVLIKYNKMSVFLNKFTTFVRKSKIYNTLLTEYHSTFTNVS